MSFDMIQRYYLRDRNRAIFYSDGDRVESQRVENGDERNAETELEEVENGNVIENAEADT